MRAALFSYVWRRGEQCHGADGRPGKSCSSRGVVVCPVLVQEQLRGWWRSGWLSGLRSRADSRVPSTKGPYAAQWRAWRRPVPVRSNSVGYVVVVPGVALQWQGWPHRADTVLHSGRDGLPRGVSGTAPGHESQARQGHGARPVVSEH
jgi:hypothetical protein